MAQLHALDGGASAARSEWLSWIYLGVGLLDLAAVVAGLASTGCIAHPTLFLRASLFAGGCTAPFFMVLVIGTRISYRRRGQLARGVSLRLLAAFALALVALAVFAWLGLATYNCGAQLASDSSAASGLTQRTG